MPRPAPHLTSIAKGESIGSREAARTEEIRCPLLPAVVRVERTLLSIAFDVGSDFDLDAVLNPANRPTALTTVEGRLFQRRVKPPTPLPPTAKTKTNKHP